VKAALEIVRVLRPGGRLALSVWRGPERNPLAAALIGVLQNCGHPAFSRAMRHPFAVENRREITAPIARAGLRLLTADTSRLRVYALNSTAFVDGFLRAMPFAGEIPEPDMQALVRETISALKPYVRQGELRVPSEAHTIVAVRAAKLFHQDLQRRK
jgi:hypothetical protein